MFDGAPVMGERDANYDWSQFTTKTSPGINGSASPVRNGPQISTNKGGNDGNSGGVQTNAAARRAVGGGGGTSRFTGTVPEGFKAQQVNGKWVLVGPDGKTYKKGDAVSFKEKYDTGGKTGGFGDSFYNKYRDASMAYYSPELAKQYTKAKSSLTFDHARAGTLQSSMASENLADLVYQNTMNDALIRSKADNATTQLKNSVAAQKTNALTQLYATEDPGVAANTATNSVRTLQNTTPEFSPLGELFQNAVVGASNYASAYNNQRNWGATPSGSGGSGSGRVVS